MKKILAFIALSLIVTSAAEARVSRGAMTTDNSNLKAYNERMEQDREQRETAERAEKAAEEAKAEKTEKEENHKPSSGKTERNEE